MDFKTENDRPEDPGLTRDEVMIHRMEPLVPCVWMETRHCIARWDEDGNGGGFEVPASTVCPAVCWRYNRKV